MKRISIDDLTGFADICECEWLLGELVAGCSEPPYNPFNDVKQDPSFLKFQEEVYNMIPEAFWFHFRKALNTPLNIH